LREIALAIINPVVPGIRGTGGNQFPIAGFLSFKNKFSGAAIAQCEARRIRIDACCSAIANSKTHATFGADIDTIQTFLFSCQRGLGRINFEVLVIVIKSSQTYSCGTFNKAERQAFVTESGNTQYRVGTHAHKIARVNLNFHARAIGCRHRVAFYQRKV
jgi:hypothetical protein